MNHELRIMNKSAANAKQTKKALPYQGANKQQITKSNKRGSDCRTVAGARNDRLRQTAKSK
jgi:hypothetical protein